MRPRVLHVLGHTFTVSEEDTMSKNKEWGYTEYATEKIVLHDETNEAVKFDTLLHEIGHVIVEFSGIRSLLKQGKDLGDREEHLVQAFGNAMAGVMTENPWVLQMANRVRANRAKRAKGEVEDGAA